MARVEAAAERVVAAPPELVYRLIADQAEHHMFLPPAFFDFAVESGGVGAGTITHFGMSAGGRIRRYRMLIGEPDPGRVLTESDMNSTLVTTFTVTPEPPGCRVRIATAWDGAGGVGGFFERTFAPRVLRRIYRDELERLEAHAAQQAGSGTP